MELTRREAVVALAAAGVTVGGGAALLAVDREDGSADHDLETMRALAPVLYPSEVTATDGFVETYVLGRVDGDRAYREAVGEAVAALDERAVEQRGAQFADLEPAEREGLLYDLEMASTEPDPGGSEAERIRYYLVNELLFALFTTPTGGELVGAENPTGHPGGLAAYQRGPQS
ncbi:MAG: gluconate 2-dehydrogenase subunit 3 family protein [Haloarculaceae archaeon]